MVLMRYCCLFTFAPFCSIVFGTGVCDKMICDSIYYIFCMLSALHRARLYLHYIELDFGKVRRYSSASEMTIELRCKHGVEAHHFDHTILVADR